MKIQSYCYTRGDKPDYRDFIIPSNLNANDRAIVCNMVKPILELENLNNPIWILYKKADLLIWGVCCRNKLLSQLHNSDEKGRGVDGFFAIVISDFSKKDLCIPYDVEYFKTLYKNEILPHWFCTNGETFNSIGGDYYSESYRFVKASENESLHLINTDIFLSKRLGVSDFEEVIASALTLDTITLAIGYDGTDSISNTNALFMNSIVPGKKEKSVSVKCACPSCGKFVSHYTYSGVCEECTKKAEHDSNSFDTDKNKNMEYKEQELTELKRQVRDYRLEIDEKNKKIKEQNRHIKILWIICGILLLLSLWLFKNSNIRINTNFAGHQSTYQKMAADEHHVPDFYLDVDSEKVEVMAEGQDSVAIGWRTNYPSVEAKMVDVDWAKITRETNNGIILSIKANKSPNTRVAQINIKPSEGKLTTIEIYQMSAE